MALDEAADDVGLSGKQEGTEGLPEQQGLLASDEAHERARCGVEKTPCLPPTQHTYSDSAAAPADAAQPAAAAAANTSGGGLGQQRKRKREGAPDAQAVEDATDALRERLAAAAGRFAVLPQKPQLWLEADLAARLGPFEMVGRTVRILWPDDDAWYLASIAGYNESTGEHLIHYADNEQESLVVALERTRLLATAGEPLLRPDSGTLRRHAAALRRLAGGQQLAARGAQLRRRAEELEAIAELPQAEPEAQERMAAEERAQAAAMQQQRGQQQQQGALHGFSSLTAQPAPRQSAAQSVLEPALLAAQPPSVVCALQQAASLPQDAPLRGVRLRNQKYRCVRVTVDRVRKDVYPQNAATAAVAADVYAVWRHVVPPGGKAAKALELNVQGAGYLEDGTLLERLRGLHDAVSVRDWLRVHVLGEPGSEAQSPEAAAPGDAAAPGHAAAPGAPTPMVVDGQEDAAPAQQPAAMGQQQCDSESGPGLSADQEVQRSEQRRGEEVSVAGQPADQEQLPSIPCRQQQQSEGDEPAGGGAAPAAAPAGAGDDAAAGVAAEEGSSGRSAAQQRQLAPGEVGWFQVKGYPHWPFLVITREEAAARGLPEAQLRNPALLPVQYFGPGEVQCINPQAVERVGKRGEPRPCFAPFLEGLERGYHTVTRGRRMSDFKRALFEVEQYFNTGELPLVMKPRHNDGHGAQQDEEDEEEAGKPSAKRRKGKGAAGAASLPVPGLPIHVNQRMQVLELGEVEWLHPAFHNEKRIFPVGYRARRIAKTPASGDEAPHVMEVLRALDGSGPLFRVTPEGCPAVEGHTATKAWQALYPSDATSKARVADVSGDLMFGLSSARVQRAIRALPGAARCDRYCGWPEGEEPAAAPLSDEERRERLACEARMQKLPQGVTPVPAAASCTHCHVCGEDDEEEQDQQGVILCCARCRMHVHAHCYYMPQAPPPDQPWLCDPCSLGLRRPPPCALCPVLGGALKRTSCGRWVHPTCALWLPETHVDEEARELHMQGVVQDLAKVKPVRYDLRCQFCRQQGAGACMQCCEPKCYAAFHPLCARQAGCSVQMEIVWSDDEEADGEQCTEAGASAQQPRQEECGTRASGDENDPAATNGSFGGAPRRGGRGKAKPQRQQEGTRRDRLRFFAFCPKHSKQRYPPAAAPAAADERPWQQGLQGQQAALLEAPCSAARAVPFNHAARRGQRAPEAEAAALAKRRFMRATPYLVGPAVQPGAAETPGSACHWRPSGAAAGAQLEAAAAAGDEGAAAAAGEQLPPQQERHAQQDGEQEHAQQQEEEEEQQQQQEERRQSCQQRQRPWFPGRLLTDDCEGGQPSSPPAGQQRVGWRPALGLKSEAGRFGDMVATQGRRVTIGKSAIHGWGGFAKTAHRAHDMVIEYVGELVRHSVSDLREQRLYDATVGAGTYVFRLNGQWCVDATRAGNLAHMLNHSCSPNCYSRTISIVGGDGAMTDHVVLFALRDIQAGEELTYNYRFCGKEQLRCNCGAPACTGLVNEKPPDHDRLLVPRSQLKPYLQPAGKQGATAAAETPEAAAGGEAAAGAPAADEAGARGDAAGGGS